MNYAWLRIAWEREEECEENSVRSLYRRMLDGAEAGAAV
jgi:hypothetical protein